MALDMLNADHHHSPPSPSPSPANASFLQMPLSLLGSVLRKQSPSPAPSNASTTTPEHHDYSTAAAAQPTDSSMTASPSRPSTSSTSPSLREKPKKRALRPKTVYNLAQPPPTSTPRQKKLSVRPKVLLQLHQVIASRRPKPVYEAVPYSILGPVSSRRLARTFQSRKLTPHDILIVSCGGYDANVDKADDESWGARDVVAIICPSKEEKGVSVRAEILLDNGQNWEVTPTPNGGYEFNHTDDHGLSLRSRWVPKSVHLRRRSTMSNGSAAASPTSAPDEAKFTFSTISANSRRHPIIASLTRSRIEINDSYVMPTATSPPTPSHPDSALPTPLATPSNIDMQSFMDPPNDRMPVSTDEALHRFIVISGVWVAFCENWSAAYSSSRLNCAALVSRTVSMPFVESPRSASPASTIDENHRTIPRIIRTSTHLLHRNSSFTHGSPEPSQSAPSSPIKTRPRRANSTGTADLHRSGSKKRFGLALEDQVLTETEEERQVKRSTEILRIKELSLPPTPNLVLTTIPSADPFPSTENGNVGNYLLPSPRIDSRATKSRSAYEPVVTAGLWDSGVVEGGGLKKRPTSMVMVNEKKQKAAKKKEQQQRSKSRDKPPKEKKEKKEHRRKSDGLKQIFTGIFRREKKGLAE